MAIDRFVVCVNDADFGEDDLYPAAEFVPVALSPEAAARLRQGLASAPPG